MEFYVIIVPPLILSALIIFRLHKMAVQDRRLFSEHSVLRKLMGPILAQNFSLSQKDYVILRYQIYNEELKEVINSNVRFTNPTKKTKSAFSLILSSMYLSPPQNFVLRCPNSKCANIRNHSADFVPEKREHHQRMRYAGSIHIGLLTQFFRTVFNLTDNLPIGTYHLYFCPVCREEALYLEKRGLLQQVYLPENCQLKWLILNLPASR